MSSISIPALSGDTPKPVHPLRIRNFRNLWAGSMISLAGDQFYLVAMPWLVLQKTGSSLALGTIMMAAAIPRAVLMLIGGAVTDRFSSRRVLVSTASARALLVGIIALLSWQNIIQLWHLYSLALMFGIADAFAFPAGAALMPTLVEPHQLPAANSVFQGSAQLTNIVAPAPAGLIVKHFGTPLAFFADALSFLAVIVALIGLPDRPRAATLPGVPKPKLLSSIKQGLAYVSGERPLLYLVMLAAAINFCLGGPISIGLATLAKFRFGSSASFGTMLSCVSAGALAGLFGAGLSKRKLNRGYILAVLSIVIGASMIVIAARPQFLVVCVALVVMGASSGFTNVHIASWMQGRVAREMLGRVMSVLMFAAIGLMPISFAVAGAVAQRHLSAMFFSAGMLVIALCSAFLFSGAAREIQ
jgi:MFS family permease